MKNTKLSKTGLISIITVIAVLLAALSSCGAIRATDLSRGFVRSGASSLEPTDAFYGAISDFGMKALSELSSQQGENVTFSPLSAALCLALITNGAQGQTQEELEVLLGMDIDEFNKMAYAFTSGLYSDKDCRVELANSVWYRDAGFLTVEDSFLQTNADWYGADIYSAPFDRTTVDDVNRWCSDKTDGTIKEMISKIDDDIVMLLLNSLCFDAKWQNKYEKSQRKDGVFNNYDGTQSEVQMLYSNEGYYIDGDGFRGFTKPYEGGKYSFVALLPTAQESSSGDVYALLEGLDGGVFYNAVKNKQSLSVSVCIPEFTNASSLDLIEPLKAMGVNTAFDLDAADFSPMATSERGNIHVGILRQESFIKVDMNGTKATAITLGGMSDKSSSAVEDRIYLDRPFVYAVVDNESGVPLFVGVMASAEGK